MRTITEVHALKVERAFVDLQLFGVVRAVQKHADTALIDTGGILVGELTVRIHRREGEVTAAQHSRAVPGQHRAAARLRNGFQHRTFNVVGIRAVDELKIIDIKIATAFGTVLSRHHTNCVTARNVNGHLERRNVRFHPNPTLTGPVTKLTAAHCAVSIVAVVLHIGGRSVQFSVKIRG